MSSHQDDIQQEIARFNEVCAREGNGVVAHMASHEGSEILFVSLDRRFWSKARCVRVAWQSVGTGENVRALLRQSLVALVRRDGR